MNIRRTICSTVATIVFGASSLAAPHPASAQMTVIDPTNLIQNTLTAVRTLEQINNQIKSLQNEATNLLKLGKTFAPELLDRLHQIDDLMDEARGVALKVQQTKLALQDFYNGDYAGKTYGELAESAAKRVDNSREALHDTLVLQAQVTEQIKDDQETLEALAQASQDSEGALGAQQATNELLAFQSAQNSRLQSLLVAQARAEALERARQMEVQAAAREEHKRFFDGAAEPYAGAKPWN